MAYLSHSGLIVSGERLLECDTQENVDDYLKRLTHTREMKVGRKTVEIVTKFYTHRQRRDSETGKVHDIYTLPRTSIKYLEALGIETVLGYAPKLCLRSTNMRAAYVGAPSENQKIVAEFLLDKVYSKANVKSGKGACVLNLRAGEGKTYLGANMIAAIGGPVLYITKRVNLVEQAIADLNKSFDKEQCSILNIRADLKSKRGGNGSGKGNDKGNCRNKVVVATINSICNTKSASKEYLSQFRFVIFDEVHSLCGESFSAAFRRVSAPFVLAMSASTCERTDGLDRIYWREFGFGCKKLPLEMRGPDDKYVIYGEAIPGVLCETTNFVSRTYCIQYWGDPKYAKNRDTGGKSGGNPHMDTAIGCAKDPYRVSMIANIVKQLYEWEGDPHPDSPTPDAIRRHVIYVFSELRKPLDWLHAELIRIGISIYDLGIEGMDDDSGGSTGQSLAQMLEDADDENGPSSKGVNNLLNNGDLNVAQYIGGIKGERATKIMQSARIILTTLGYSNEGVSRSDATVTIHMTARRSGYKQCLGRCRRKNGDITIPRLNFDIRDMRAFINKQYEDRLKVYEYYKHDIVTLRIEAPPTYHEIMENINGCRTNKDQPPHAPNSKFARTLKLQLREKWESTFPTFEVGDIGGITHVPDSGSGPKIKYRVASGGGDFVGELLESMEV